MHSADVRAGMTVADIGAGDGYYTVRLAARVGAGGRVLAQDIQPEVIERLADRIARERLDNVSLKLGAVDDPRRPANSSDPRSEERRVGKECVSRVKFRGAPDHK